MNAFDELHFRVSTRAAPSTPTLLTVTQCAAPFQPIANCTFLVEMVCRSCTFALMPSPSIDLSTDDLGRSNAARVRGEPAAVSMLADLLQIQEKEVRKRLEGVHGRTLVRNIFPDFVLKTGDAWEEVDDEGETGVEEELEDLTSERVAIRPYDPDKIRVDPKTFSLQQIIEDIDSTDLDLAPDFQRNKVWRTRQKVRLVESVLLRIPLPAFYFSADRTGRSSVVDGVQRLSTLHAFVKNKFPLTRQDLEYLSSESLAHPESRATAADEVYYRELDQQWTRRMRQTQLTVNVIDPQTPEEVKFEIFKRINTGGSPLNPQEIRHSMMRKRGRDFLADLSRMDSFRSAVPEKLHAHSRMADREVILRFLAFVLLEDVTLYAEATMDSFLMQAAKRLDDVEDLSDEVLHQLRGEFDTAMRNAKSLFGTYAFRKWPRDRERLQPFNKALFESWAFALRKVPENAIGAAKAAITVDARDLMADRSYLESITVSTGDVRKVRTRFGKALAVVERHIQ